MSSRPTAASALATISRHTSLRAASAGSHIIGVDFACDQPRIFFLERAYSSTETARFPCRLSFTQTASLVARTDYASAVVSMREPPWVSQSRKFSARSCPIRVCTQSLVDPEQLLLYQMRSRRSIGHVSWIESSDHRLGLSGKNLYVARRL